jgi:hypothetical protein
MDFCSSPPSSLPFSCHLINMSFYLFFIQFDHYYFDCYLFCFFIFFIYLFFFNFVHHHLVSFNLLKIDLHVFLVRFSLYEVISIMCLGSRG